MESKLLIISPVYNEERLLPFHFHYYNYLIDLQRNKESNLIYIDFGSDDFSVELIQSFIAQNPNVSLIHCDTKEHREDVLMLFRNHYYKQFSSPADESNYDWVFTVDIDEFLFNRRLIEILDLKKDSDTTIFKMKGYDVVMDSVPETKFTCEDILDNYTLEGIRDTSLDKNLIFNPSKVDIQHDFGCHTAQPRGFRSLFYKSGDVFWDDTVVYNLSFRYLGMEYFRYINTEKSKRTKEYAKKTHYGFHYENHLEDMDSRYNDYTRKKELLNLDD